MTYELWALAGAIVLGFAHIGAQGLALKSQAGNAYTVSARDEEVQVSGRAGRLARASRNFNESFPLFAAAVLTAHIADRSGWASQIGVCLYLACRVLYLPAYAFYVPRLRTVLWQISMVGILLVLVQLALPQ